MSAVASGTLDSTTRAPSRSRSCTHASAASLVSVARPSPIPGGRRSRPTVRPSSRGSGTGSPVEDRPEQRHVGNRAGHRPDGVERRAERKDALHRDPAPLRLQPDDAARGRRQPDRAPGVGAQSEVAEARRERRGAAGARAAGRTTRPRGVVAHAEQLVVAEHAPGELRQVRLADDHGTRVERALDDGRVRLRHVIGEQARAVRRAHARDVDQVLHRRACAPRAGRRAELLGAARRAV